MFVDAYVDHKHNNVKVAERQNGLRKLVDYPIEHVFYYTHPSGSHKTMDGQACRKYSTYDAQKYKKELRRITDIQDREGKPRHTIYESDINPVFRALETHYRNAQTPNLNVAFFDIETGFDQDRGFAPVDDPFNPITAISIHLSHIDRLVTVALVPPTLTMDEAREMCREFPDTFLFDNEEDMLMTFCALIEDADVLSGWNCIPKTETVWLRDRILPLGDIRVGNQTYQDGGVLHYHDSGKKVVNNITLSNGAILQASDEHRIPARVGKNPPRDYTVGELKELITSNVVELEYALRNNTNTALTYREYFLDYLHHTTDMAKRIRINGQVVNLENESVMMRLLKDNTTIEITVAKREYIVELDHALDPTVKWFNQLNGSDYNIAVLSRLSADQFSNFRDNALDNSTTMWGTATQNRHMQELMAWNGIMSTIHEDALVMVGRMDRDCPLWVKIMDIETTKIMVEMADIETQNHYFNCRGIRVHNSTFFDIPYIVNRIKRRIGKKETSRLCLWEQQPRERTVSRYGKDHQTYDLCGRVHLDYLELYQKHNPQQQHSYRLDFIGEIEVGENKVPYDGTLDDLYKKDFKKFIEYSRQDVALLVKIDKKKRFIELANQIAHVNCVPFKTTMGSVALVEQAIILEIHDMGLVAPNRRVKDIIEDDPDDEFYDEDDDEDRKKKPVVGAYVAKPKKGLHEHVAAMDINSLYPSTIRALNISPETIVGQVRSDRTKALVAKRIAEGTARAEAWDGIFATLEVEAMWDRTDELLTIDFDAGETKTMTAAQLHDYIFNPKNHLCISANGTIFKTDRDGVIPQLLAKWYAERKQMQGVKDLYVEIDGGLKISDDLADLIGDWDE